MNPSFIAIAAAAAVAAVALVAWPLLRTAGTATAVHGRRDWGAAVLVAVLLCGGAAGLYVTWSNWSWSQPTHAAGGTAEDMVAALARRLETQPEDLQGWLMLGRSYAALEQFPLAARAYQRASNLAGDRNADALTGWGEALIMQDESALAGRGGRLFEQALAIDPGSQKALFYGAVAAQRRGEAQLAIERYTRLLALAPPENVRPLLEAQIAALEGGAAAGGPMTGAAADRGTAAGDAAAGAGGAAAGAAPGAAADGRGAGAVGAGPVVRVRVVASNALAAKIAAGAPLFVFVRKPGEPGPPLAVKRLDAKLPQLVELRAADAMVAERSFAAGDTVEVVARVSLGGQPMASSGDPYGQLRYDVGRGGEKELVIDRLTP